MRTFYLCMILVLANAAFSEPTEEERVNELQKRILQQQQILQELEQKLQAREENVRSYTEQLVQEYLCQPWIEDSQGINAGYEKGFFVQSSDGDYKLLMNGYFINTLYIYETETVTDNSFRLSWARLDFHMYLLKDWHIRVRSDFSDNSSSLREGFIEYLGFDCIQPRIGAWLIPFSMEHEAGAMNTIGIAASPYITSVPHREVGFGIYGNGLPWIESEYLSEHLSYFVGVFNGQGRNRLDMGDGKMFMANVKFYPLGRQFKEVVIQASYLHNDQGFKEDGAAITLGALQNHKVFGNPNPSSATDSDDINGNVTGYSVAARYWKDNIRMEAETILMYYERRQEPGILSDGLTDLRLWGISGGASYFIALGKSESNMGIEPLLKFSYTEIEDEHGDGSASSYASAPLGTASDVLGQSVWEFVIGAKFHFNKHLRFDFNWVMYDLEKTSGGLTNHDTGKGGALIHAFLFQCITRW